MSLAKAFILLLASKLSIISVSVIENKRKEKNINGPELCTDMECSELVFLWTVGINGMCLPDIYGALIGEGGFKAVYMQVTSCP